MGQWEILESLRKGRGTSTKQIESMLNISYASASGGLKRLKRGNLVKCKKRLTCKGKYEYVYTKI